MATAAFTASLRSLVTSPSASRADTLADGLAKLASHELRDLEPDETMLEALLNVAAVAFESPSGCQGSPTLTFEPPLLHQWHTLLAGVLQLPEVVAAAPTAAPFLTAVFLDAALERASQPPADDVGDVPTAGGVTRGVAGAADLPAGGKRAAPPSRPSAPRPELASPASAPSAAAAQAAEIAAIRALLHWAYRSDCATVRAHLRAAIGQTCLTLSSSSVPPPGLKMLLEVLASIIRGFGAPHAAHKGLMRSVLVPLHRPSGRLDETTPVLALYHEALVHCMVSLITKQPALLLVGLPPILTAWPEPREGNSSKEVGTGASAPNDTPVKLPPPPKPRQWPCQTAHRCVLGSLSRSLASHPFVSRSFHAPRRIPTTCPPSTSCSAKPPARDSIETHARPSRRYCCCTSSRACSSSPAPPTARQSLSHAHPSSHVASAPTTRASPSGRSPSSPMTPLAPLCSPTIVLPCRYSSPRSCAEVTPTPRPCPHHSALPPSSPSAPTPLIVSSPPTPLLVPKGRLTGTRR